ncbi:MAG: glycosyltransferase family 4 protein [Candidatus Cybelea sp.]
MEGKTLMVSRNAEKIERDPIRILAFLDATVVSGNVKPVLALARYTRKNAAIDHRPLEFSLLAFVRSESDPEMVNALREEGFTVDVVRERHRFDFRVFPQLRAIVELRQPDVLWTHGTKPHFLVRAAGLSRKRAWIAFHHGYTATTLAWRLYHQLDRWSLRGANRVMTACEAFAKDLNCRLGVSRERLSVHRSPLAADSSRRNRSDIDRVPERLDLPNDARIVLSVGRLSKEKGHADLIRAMQLVCQQHRGAVLVIVGDGPERRRLEHLCDQLRLGTSVRFVGYSDDVTPYYEAATVFALTSHSEGSPNVLLEAMQAAVPIVATAVGGVGEMIRHREHALLVQRGDVKGIAAGIVALLSDPELCRTFTAAAHQSLAAYSLERYDSGVASQFEAVVLPR